MSNTREQVLGKAAANSLRPGDRESVQLNVHGTDRTFYTGRDAKGELYATDGEWMVFLNDRYEITHSGKL